METNVYVERKGYRVKVETGQLGDDFVENFTSVRLTFEAKGEAKPLPPAEFRVNNVNPVSVEQLIDLALAKSK